MSSIQNDLAFRVTGDIFHQVAMQRDKTEVNVTVCSELARE